MYTISSTLLSGHDNLVKLLHYILHDSGLGGGCLSNNVRYTESVQVESMGLLTGMMIVQISEAGRSGGSLGWHSQ